MLNATIIVLLTISAKTRAAQLKARRMYKHRTSGIGCSLRENMGSAGLAAIICGARERLAIIPSPAHKPTDIPFFFPTWMLTRAFRSVSVSSGGRIDLATLVGSEGPTSIKRPDLVQIKPQSSTARHRAG